MTNDLSISITLYSRRREGNTVSFYLRNLLQSNDVAQIIQAKEIMDEVAKELHHITGYGVDKGTIKSDGKKIEQVVYDDLEPRFGSESDIFKHKVKFSFDVHLKSCLPEKKQKYLRATRASFALPCVIDTRLTRPDNEESSPLFFLGVRKHLVYKREDPIFQHFIARFYNQGHLCIDSKRYYIAKDFDGESVLTKLLLNACFSRGQRKGKSEDNIRVIQLASKPVEKPQPTFKTSKRASLPLDGTDYVYIIRAGRRKVYKIGKSNDPQARLNSLQTASPEKLKLIYAFKADNASAAEESLHFVLRDFQLGGEWFALSDEQMEVLLGIEEFKEKSFVIGAQLFGLQDMVLKLKR